MIYQSLNLISQSERGPVCTGQGIPCKENGPAAKYFGETWDSAFLRKETTNVSNFETDWNVSFGLKQRLEAV